ncbi:MAG TPA: haloalkane dehalogenase [Actinobacteria bacterium]|nr:haloalkane dehalogenase [Actinomycetota bacterium]
MKTLRTPDERFAGLPGYPFEPHYVDVPTGDGEGSLRMHYVDEGPAEGELVLLLHGEPSWSYLYRKMIPVLAQAALRAVAPDLVGFGKSDKPSRRQDHTYQRHVGWTSAFLQVTDLHNITLVCQDWGGLIGLRLVAEQPERFARVVAANTGLPTGQSSLGQQFQEWRRFSQETPELPIGGIVQLGTTTDLPDDIVAAYDAPFPDESYKEGARQFPSLVPTSLDDPASPANLKAWEQLATFDKPFLTAFSDRDPITRGGERILQKTVPGAQGQPHVTIEGVGHFLQEDRGEDLAQVVVDFIRRTPR